MKGAHIEIESVDDVVEEMKLLFSNQKDVEDALSSGVGNEIDDDEIEEELKMLLLDDAPMTNSKPIESVTQKIEQSKNTKEPIIEQTKESPITEQTKESPIIEKTKQKLSQHSSQNTEKRVLLEG